MVIFLRIQHLLFETNSEFYLCKKVKHCPKKEMNHIRKSIGIFGELLVSFRVPVGWNISLLIFEKIDCFPSQICRTGRPCHWPEPVMSLGFGCFLLFFGGGPLRVGWTLWDCCIPNLCTNIVNTEFTVANGQSLPSSLCEDWHCVRHDVTPQFFRNVLDGWVSVVVSIQTGSFHGI